ncbi:MAG: HlyD family efflux transporter periplasmic adaptor subunit [Nannocystaceae bacterium]
MRDALGIRILPWLVWLCAVAGAIGLWRDPAIGEAPGFVEAVLVEVSAAEAGEIVALEVVVGQRVRAGEVVARLDGAAIEAELEILAAERLRKEAEIGAVEGEVAAELGAQRRDAAAQVDESERALERARAERSSRSAELGALRSQIEATRRLVDQRMVPRAELDALEVKAATIAGELAAAKAPAARLDGHAEGARGRESEAPAADAAAARASAPLKAELAAIAGRERLLRLRQAALELRAPIDGEVVAIHGRAGERASAGGSALTIAGSDPAAAGPVVVCLSEAQGARVRPGSAVLLSAPGAEGEPLRGRVAQVAAEVLELPPRCRRDPSIPAWGRAARVVVDDPQALVPGQSLGVTLLGGDAEEAS